MGGFGPPTLGGIMSKPINMVTEYLYGKTIPTSPKESYGHSDWKGRGFLTMDQMSGERGKEFMMDQKRTNNMVNVEGDMVGSWNLEF
jgi:hypothetical protein